MTARFIVRLLDSAGSLLSWAEVYAKAKPQDRAGSCPFWATTATQFVIDDDGTASQVSVHWADLDVARVQALDPTQVKTGQVLTMSWIEPVWLVPGMRDVPLPNVTIRSPVRVGVPTGGLGARDPRLG
jgi:hypothetical protein